MAIKQKGFAEYLTGDPSLAEKFTYDEFYSQKNVMPDNEDVTIEQAINACIEMCNKLEETV